MPRLVRLYIWSVAIGFAMSAGFTALLLWLNVAGIGGLILGSKVGWIAAAMLFVFFGILFSGVQFAIRIMMMAESGDGPRGGLRQHLVPQRVRAGAAVRRR